MEALFFHAWQDAYYPGGISQYAETGRVNIEFEAKFFKDLLNNPEMFNGCCYAFSGNLPSNLYGEYLNWILDIKSSGTMNFQDSDYQRWLNLFQQYDLNYTSPMSNDLLTPIALRYLINNATCL
jgi:hypothetical protein